MKKFCFSLYLIFYIFLLIATTSWVNAGVDDDFHTNYAIEESDDADEEFEDGEAADHSFIKDIYEEPVGLRALHKVVNYSHEKNVVYAKEISHKHPYHYSLCPTGYAYDKGNCVAYELVQPAKKCPPGYEPSELDKCIQYYKGELHCPDECQISGDKCVCVHTKPARHICIEGEYDSKSKVCHVSEKKPPHCPPGYEFSSNKKTCVQWVPATLKCLEGTKHGRECKVTKSWEPYSICPPGSEVDSSGKGCYKLKYAPPKCPRKYILSKKKAKCFKKIQKQLAPCQEGFHPVEGLEVLCAKKTKVPPEMVCPEKFVVDHRTGQCVHEIPVSPICPEGYSKSFSDDKVCEKAIDEVSHCPLGSHAVSGNHTVKCEETIEHDLTECCPPGFEVFNKKCEKLECYESPKPCVNCANFERTPPTYACPEGFDLKGKSCIKVLPKPCEEKHDEEKVQKKESKKANDEVKTKHAHKPQHKFVDEEDEYEQDYKQHEQKKKKKVPTYPHTVEDEDEYTIEEKKHWKHKRKDALSEKDSESIQCEHYQRFLQSVSLRTAEEAEAYNIPHRCIIEQPTNPPKLCKEEVSVPAQIKCPKEAILLDHVCVVKHDILKPKICHEGDFNEALGKCCKKIVVPSKAECPNGTKLVKNKCIQYNYLYPTIMCPPESKEDKKTKQCLIHQPVIEQPPEIVTTPPTIVCTSGVLEKGYCWVEERTKRQYVCPEKSVPATEEDNDKINFNDKHDCIVFVDVIIPPPKKIEIKPLHYCSHGTKVTAHNKCYAFYSLEMEHVCPPDTEKIHNKCQKKLSPLSSSPHVFTLVPTLLCHQGSTLKGGKCIDAKEFTPKVTCPPEYHIHLPLIQNKECSKETKKVHICPPKSQHTHEGCLLKKTASPIHMKLPHKDCHDKICDEHNYFSK